MPKRKTVTKMEAKMTDLEEEMASMKIAFSASIAEINQTARENQRALMQMMERVLGKKVVVEDDTNSSARNGVVTNEIPVTSSKKATTVSELRGDALDEFRRSVKKIELPAFSGEDPAGWISRAEVYFRVQETSVTVKMGLAQLSMEGPTIHFFNSLIEENPALTWEEFKAELLETFMNNLLIYAREDEIRGRVRSFVAMGPITRSKLFHVTRAVEKELYGGSGWTRNPKGGGSNRVNPGRQGGTDWVFVKGGQNNGSNSGVGPKGTSGPNRDFKHVSTEKKRGGPFHPLHQCPDKQLRIMIVDEEDVGDDEAKLLAVEVDESDEEQGGEMSVMSISELEGFQREKIQTLKLRATINGVPVVVLVDSGATHNFIAKSMVQKLGWQVENTPDFRIKLGDGFQTITRGKCPQILFKTGEVSWEIEAYLFDLDGVDVVVGMAWLKSLGDMIVNWKKQTMEFWHEGNWVMLKGIEGTAEAIPALQSVVGRASKGYGKKWWSLEADLNNTEGKLEPIIEHPELKSILESFENVFQEPKGLPPCRSRDHAINLVSGQGPVNVRPYRYPHHQKNEIERQVKEMLEGGIIQHSGSAFSSPVILVKKKDGTWRMCVDYRALNKVTVPDKFPIPVIDELLDELHGAQYFTKLDLKSGYHQVRVKPEDVHKTAFRTHDGHYEYLVMPFGLMNAPSTFQSLMNEVFRPLLRKFVLVFFDDILIYSKSWQTHILELTEVLQILKRHNKLVANRKKCQFGQRAVEYLGHLITGSGVAVDPMKVQSVIQWPVPKNVKGVRGFLGLTGYYRKFIKDYGKIAKPLTELTKKEGFKWGPQAQKAFEVLKQKLTTAPVLALPDFDKEFVVECDASGVGLGAILMQERKPIAFFSKALGGKSLAKSAYERELMAVALAVQHWCPYLLGRHFIVTTDQKSLKQLWQQRITTPDQQNWATKLLGYQFDIVYKPGVENRGADALSRLPEGELEALVSYPIWEEGTVIQEEVHKDKALLKIIKDLEDKPDSRPGFKYKQEVLFYEDRLVLSAQSSLITKMLEEFHVTPEGGHSGFYRTYRRLAANVYWIGMKARVQEYVKACDVCQRQKYLAVAPGGLLQPLPIPSAIWEEVSMDFITELPKSRGFEAVFVVVDRLSKYCHFIPLKRPYIARTVAEVFAREVIRLHGLPTAIVSDRDPLFISNFWTELFRLQGTTLKMSSAYHPETDGQTEVVNRCLETYLRCFIADQPRSWMSWIPWAEFWFNTTFHAATGSTPFELVYGRKPPVITRLLQGETRVAAVQKELEERDEALKQLRVHLQRAQDRMKNFADAKRTDRSFNVGEWVFLKLRPYRQQSVVSRINVKLAVRYYVEHELPQEVEESGVEHFTPEGVLATRLNGPEGQRVKQVLIQWTDKAVEEATWEDMVTIANQFPEFNLEDKVALLEGGIVRDQVNEMRPDIEVTNHNGPRNVMTWQVYSRRKKGGSPIT
ncbi:hypothetical protein TSUD_372530 [Trifolium subterraneum]|uniref:Ty3/gypsy retrotransposon protein n=1 Tax=Trifolium subterraneum TaxID=3900 RepID=A0A2Z6M8E3_TRISU|nr:hypothetical protein TSUD_372530 [Trifolium subterraneum]